MNNNQRIVIQTCLGLCALFALFPPLANSTESLLFSIPVGYKIDLENFVLRIFLVLTIGGIFWIYFGQTWEKSKNARTADMHQEGSLGVLNDYFLGRKPLWKAFWIVAVIGGSIVTLVTLKFRTLPNLAAIILLLSTALMYTYNFWGAMSVWRCAKNSRSTLQMYIARGSILIMYLAFLFSTTFLFWPIP
ncbi:MAG: hypothetical protein EPN97_18510 [Alphaproteobacteria bacterium]|nr:MAG: hypothetical protein EPN97_18510 [Alphaproteobacteria bacterium]